MVIILLFPTLPVLNQISLYSIFILALLSIWSSSFLLALSWIFFGQLLNDLYSYIVVGVGLDEGEASIRVNTINQPGTEAGAIVASAGYFVSRPTWVLLAEYWWSENWSRFSPLNIIRSQNCSAAADLNTADRKFAQYHSIPKLFLQLTCSPPFPSAGQPLPLWLESGLSTFGFLAGKRFLWERQSRMEKLILRRLTSGWLPSGQVQEVGRLKWRSSWICLVLVILVNFDFNRSRSLFYFVPQESHRNAWSWLG